MIEFTREDLLRSKIITPAWYRVHIDNVEGKLSKAGDSTNIAVTGTILYNADNGSKEFADVIIGGIPAWFFNTKAKGFMTGIIRAIDPSTEIIEGFRFNENALIGKEIDVFVDNEMYEGVMRNRVNHKYRAPRELSQEV